MFNRIDDNSIIGIFSRNIDFLNGTGSIFSITVAQLLYILQADEVYKSFCGADCGMNNGSTELWDKWMALCLSYRKYYDHGKFRKAKIVLRIICRAIEYVPHMEQPYFLSYIDDEKGKRFKEQVLDIEDLDRMLAK